jgi:hypothetical protein
MVLKKQQAVACAVLIPAQYTNQRTKKTQGRPANPQIPVFAEPA